MNLFWLLLLAHFIADFPLQSDKIFALKSKYKWGVLPHIFISFIANLVVAFPYLGFKNFWYAVLFLVSIHFLLDWLKIVLTKRFLSDSMFIFLLDQMFHIFFIWLTCFYLFDIPPPDIKNKLITSYYLNKKVILVLTGLIFSIFGGGVLIHYIRKIFHRIKTKGSGEQVVFPNINKRRIGYIERFFSTLGVIFGGWLLIMVPLAFLPRLIILRKTDNQEYLMINLVAGLFITIGTGLFIHLLC
jgi:hypothetical protein